MVSGRFTRCTCEWRVRRSRVPGALVAPERHGGRRIVSCENGRKSGGTDTVSPLDVWAPATDPLASGRRPEKAHRIRGARVDRLILAPGRGPGFRRPGARPPRGRILEIVARQEWVATGLRGAKPRARAILAEEPDPGGGGARRVLACRVAAIQRTPHGWRRLDDLDPEGPSLDDVIRLTVANALRSSRALAGPRLLVEPTGVGAVGFHEPVGDLTAGHEDRVPAREQRVQHLLDVADAVEHAAQVVVEG
jgi:hypothetical protein